MANGFGPHNVISNGELFGTVVAFVLVLMLSALIAAALGRRRLAEVDQTRLSGR